MKPVIQISCNINNNFETYSFHALSLSTTPTLRVKDTLSNGSAGIPCGVIPTCCCAIYKISTVNPWLLDQ